MYSQRFAVGRVRPYPCNRIHTHGAPLYAYTIVYPNLINPIELDIFQQLSQNHIVRLER